jgi:hypothetical protein
LDQLAAGKLFVSFLSLLVDFQELKHRQQVEMDRAAPDSVTVERGPVAPSDNVEPPSANPSPFRTCRFLSVMIKGNETFHTNARYLKEKTAKVRVCLGP